MQVIAFSDEEGVRYQSTFLGSAAVAGILPVSALKISDKRFPWIIPIIYLFETLFTINVLICNKSLFSDVTIEDALKKNSIEITEEHLLQLKYDPKSVWGYVEVR